MNGMKVSGRACASMYVYAIVRLPLEFSVFVLGEPKLEVTS